MAAPNRIAVVTTSRADYGIYRPLLETLRATGRELHLIAGGTHPLERFGRTLNEIHADAFGRVHVIEHMVEGDRGVDLADSAGAAISGYAGVLDAVKPDLCFVLGDRYEMLAAGLAAAILKTPLAHLHGGDCTEGSTDDSFRHALTKLSHVHFPAIEQHAACIRAMGEEPWRVHTVGALALDGHRMFKSGLPGPLLREAGFDQEKRTLLLLFHPETLSPLAPSEQVDRVLRGLGDFDGNVLVIGTNADEGHEDLTNALREWAAARPQTKFVESLPQKEFWNWMSIACVMIGNSSAGIIERAGPAVNVGDRQKGRVRDINVIDVPCDAEAIANAIAYSQSRTFMDQQKKTSNWKRPYGDGHAAERILAVLESLPERATLLRKRWAAT